MVLRARKNCESSGKISQVERKRRATDTWPPYSRSHAALNSAIAAPRVAAYPDRSAHAVSVL